MNTTTVAAVATPSGFGGIGIVKITGPEAIRIAQRIFRKKCPDTTDLPAQNAENFESHRLHYGVIIDPQNGRTVDEVLLAVMKAPYSYTREDVVEIQAHAGPVALQAVMEIVLAAGAQMAEAGEFTRRAFINGRIDLTQAEAVIDIINAKSETALTAASVQLSGRFKEKIETIKAELENSYAVIEAGIDFPDEVDDALNRTDVTDRLQEDVIGPIHELLQQHESMRYFKDGISLAIIGKPNVGKSSLLNCLLQQERAIVTEKPGTTRDVISERLNINGIPIEILDTAGIHRTCDRIENIGIQKARDCIDTADIVLFVIDASQPVDHEDLYISNQIDPNHSILVYNKIDLLVNATQPWSQAPADWDDRFRVAISAKFGDGLEQLKKTVVQLTVGHINNTARTPIIPNLRHKQLLEFCLESLNTVCSGIDTQQPMELIAIDLKAAIGALEDLLGVRVRTDILDQIFQQFCIGK